jgi:peroxiredoxin
LRILLAIAVIIFTWISSARAELATQPHLVRPVLIGQNVPDASVRTMDNKTISIRKLLNGKPTVLVFYRGGWCPFCNTQLSNLRKTEVPLKEMGFQLIAVSPDLPAELRATAGKRELSYTLVSDAKADAMQAFNIGYRVDDKLNEQMIGWGINLQTRSGETHHGLPVPSVFVIDADGLIQFEYVNPNYKIRAPEGVILAAARAVIDVKKFK